MRVTSHSYNVSLLGPILLFLLLVSGSLAAPKEESPFPGLGEEYVLKELFQLSQKDYPSIQIGVDEKERIYVFVKTKRRVDVFNTSGKLLRSMDLPISRYSRKILVNGDGRFACLGSFYIYLFEPNGKPLTVLYVQGYDTVNTVFEDGRLLERKHLLYDGPVDEVRLLLDLKTNKKAAGVSLGRSRSRFPEEIPGTTHFTYTEEKGAQTDKSGNNYMYYSSTGFFIRYRIPHSANDEIALCKFDKDYRLISSLLIGNDALNRKTEDIFHFASDDKGVIHIVKYECLGARKRKSANAR